MATILMYAHAEGSVFELFIVVAMIRTIFVIDQVVEVTIQRVSAPNISSSATLKVPQSDGLYRGSIPPANMLTCIMRC